MGAPKYAKRRDASEKPLVKSLRALGVSVYLMDEPYDALIGLFGVTHLAEFKTPDTHYGKKLNKNQAKFSMVWLGSPPVIFRTDEDVFAWYKEQNNLRLKRPDGSESPAKPTTEEPKKEVLTYGN